MGKLNSKTRGSIGKYWAQMSATKTTSRTCATKTRTRAVDKSVRRNRSSSCTTTGAQGIEEKIAALASRRNLEDLTVGPTLTVTTKTMLDHAAKLAALPGARIAFGGKELNGGAHDVRPSGGAEHGGVRSSQNHHGERRKLQARHD